MISTPIHDFLKKYADSGIARFHMPGHKGNGTYFNNADSSSLRSLAWNLRHDITEIKGADALYSADGIIKESEANAASLFGTAATLYSVEGSSQCIRAMLALAAGFSANNSDPSRKPLILAARNVHHAFITAAVHLDLDIEWLYPETDAYTLCACPVSAAQVEQALSRLSVKPVAVYLTSPDYLGNLQNIAGISRVAHQHGIPLLVDNAHGAYLHFLDTPMHPMDLGADMCCDSAHKTLPALTGCAYLHISRNAPDRFLKYAKTAMALFGSTSPSYLLMESLDLTNAVLDAGWKESLGACLRHVDACRQHLRASGWKLLQDHSEYMRFSDPNTSPAPGSQDIPASSAGSSQFFEPLKITLNAASHGYSGNELAEILRSCGIECEYADPDYLVLMPSPGNTQEDFARLISALKSVLPKDSGRKVIPARMQFIRPRQVLSVREAAFADSEIVPVEQAAGRICSELSLSCPPAVPLIICGEEIPVQVIPVLQYYGTQSISVCKQIR